MTWPTSPKPLSEAERTLLATLRQLPRFHPVASMFAFDLPPSAADATKWVELPAPVTAAQL